MAVVQTWRELNVVATLEEAADPLAGEPNRVIRDVDATLRRLRELLHSHGRLSSRNEALDEVAVLLFAHAMGMRRDGAGITSFSIAQQHGDGTAERLRNFVAGTIATCLPQSLAHEVNPEDFALRLKPHEDAIADRIIEILQDLELGSHGDPLRVDFINEAFGRFLADSFVDEKELGQYLTPPEVVDFMVRLAVDHLTDDERDSLASDDPAAGFGYVLDPSCGVGSFLAEFIRIAHEEVVSRHGGDQDWQARVTQNVVVGIDKSERMVRLALANLALFGAPAARLHLANALATSGRDGAITNELTNRVGLILTNPPFGATFTGSELEHYRIANSWATRRPASVDSELLFLERYISWLRPGGQLFAIVPDSVLTNKGLFADLRRGIGPLVDIATVVSLPPVTFAAAGTTTKTSILHLRRRPAQSSGNKLATNFAICNSLGFSVSTRGSQRSKIRQGLNDLPQLLAALAVGDGTVVRSVRDVQNQSRWDATFHASLSDAAEAHLSSVGTRLGDVASLVCEKRDPRRIGDAQTFAYIEISDVDGDSYAVNHKTVRVDAAPSRARQVVRAGDVLISTVRPERRTVGVVPPWLDGAICTTGFAVLRPNRLDGFVLAGLLRSQFVTDQLLRNNVGIAYPAIDAGCLPDIVLPIQPGDDTRLASSAAELQRVREWLRVAQEEFDRALRAATERTLRQVPDVIQIREPDSVANSA